VGDDGPDKLDASETPDSIDADPTDDATEPAEPRLPHPRLLRAFEILCDVVKPGLSRLLDRDDLTTKIDDWFKELRLLLDDLLLPAKNPLGSLSVLCIRERLL
jgi:hypothetical protein